MMTKLSLFKKLFKFRENNIEIALFDVKTNKCLFMIDTDYIHKFVKITDEDILSFDRGSVRLVMHSKN